MNDFARRMVMDRARRDYAYRPRRNRDYDMEEYDRRRRDYEYEDRRRRDYEYEDRRRNRGDMRLSDDIGTEPEYPYETDGKQGVKGTGPYGIGGRLYSRGRDYGDDDYRDYDYEMDGHHPSGLMHLKKKDFMRWEKNLENADGSQGKHFSAEHVKKTAEQLGIKYRGFDEKELCMTVNMLYSDYCEVLKALIPQDKELVVYTKLAAAWLEDPDSPVEGSEKLALYYWCIVNDEE